MSIKYVVRKKVFGFDKTKTEKYVAQTFSAGNLNFKDLCDEVTKVGMAPSGVVKFVIDALIDTLNMNMNKGITVQLGDFGCFRPALSSRSQEAANNVDAGTVRRRKIVFTPGYKFRNMLKSVSIERLVLPSNDVPEKGEAEDPTV